MPDDAARDLVRIVRSIVAAEVDVAVRRVLLPLIDPLRATLSAIDPVGGTKVLVAKIAPSGHGRKRRGTSGGKAISAAVIKFRGKSQSPAEWARELQVPGLTRTLIIARVRNGWAPRRALCEPPHPPKSGKAKTGAPAASPKSRPAHSGDGAEREVPAPAVKVPPATLMATVPARIETPPATKTEALSKSQLAMMAARIELGVDGITETDRAVLAEHPEVRQFSYSTKSRARKPSRRPSQSLCSAWAPGGCTWA
jgi:hypothetical protein